MVNKRLLFHFFLLFGLITSLFTFPIYSAISVEGVKTDLKKTPRGSKAPIFYVNIKATNGDETVNSITISNVSSQVAFGNGITEVSIYKDSNSNLTFDESSDEQKKKAGATGGQTLTIDQWSEIISSGNSMGFFIVYTISDTAVLDATTNITIDNIKTLSSSEANFGNKEKTNTITITGFRLINASSVAPTIVLPSQEKVPILYVTLKMGGEKLQNDLSIRIENAANNFVTSATDKKGVVKAHLYQDNIGNFNPNFFDPNDPTANKFIMTVNAGEFASTSNLIFKPADKLPIADEVTVNLIIAYDIGSNFPVSSDSKVNAQLTLISGTGNESKLTVSVAGGKPSTPAVSKVAGLGFGNLKKIVPDGNFGKRTQIPMLRFSLFGFQTSVTLNTVSLQNNGTVPYLTSPGGTDGVTKIAIYEDSNGNGEYDGEISSDILIGPLTLGDTGLNQAESAQIQIRKNNVSLPISEFTSLKEYPQNNEKRFFVIYFLGEQIKKATDPSGTVLTSVSTLLKNATASANIGEKTISLFLTGDLPAASSPDATVLLKEINVSVLDIRSLSPGNVVQGQEKVPMLSITLFSDENIPSATMEILNKKGTFLSNNLGVTKVWLYRDSNQNKALETSDLQLIASDRFDKTDIVKLNGIPLFKGENHFLIHYDIGQIANISVSNNIWAQIQKLDGGTTAIVLGGEIPIPKEAATANVIAKRISISSLTPQIGVSSTFNITITVQNTHSQAVTLNATYPRFFLGGASGMDISYEFKCDLTNALIIFPRVINTSGSESYTYACGHSDKISNGTVFIDGFVDYAISPSYNAILTRYKGDSAWFFAAPTAQQITIQSEKKKYPWLVPNYIDLIQVKFGQSTKTFINYDSVAQNSSLFIHLKNSGRSIDESSIQLLLNSQTLTKNSEQATNSFSYDRVTGKITVWDLGTNNGLLRMNLKDIEGQPLEETALSFSISSVVQVSAFYAYPNPFQIGAKELILGFNLSQDALVHVYIFNHLGIEVDHIEYNGVLGNNTIRIAALKDFLRSGIYICKLIAKDVNGNQVTAVTKLAVF